MEETFSSLVHPLPPPLSSPSPSPRPACTPDREPRAAPVAASPQRSGLQAVNICPPPRAPRAGCWWEADAHRVGPRRVGVLGRGRFRGDFHHGA